MNAYITDVAAYLPHEPIENDQIEDILGKVNDLPSRTRRIVLKNNGIKQRHYAIDPATGRLTHSNAGLAAEAIRRLTPCPGFELSAIETLCCATTSPDLLFPGHALMVLGELGIPACEAVSTHGICISGMTALKYAYMNVAMGLSENAVASASELSSSFMRAKFLSARSDPDTDLSQKPIRAFDADFLRWMLSDGAGAVFISGRPADGRISLRIDWIDQISYAGQIDTCMYAGGAKEPDGSIAGWRQTESIPETEKPYLFSVRQDIRLLERHITATMGRALATIADRHHLEPNSIDWFLPHYSSAYFRPKFYDVMKEVNFEIPEKKWFTNLPTKGNTGSAAIYIIIEELFHSGRIQKGQQLLCFIPESGRFSHCFMLLTAV
ncbi:MAG: hypothetical protein DSY89_10685 [Deltaproteobacteria bacterium]|nr:MAG: hypothetical protein DSY89_10685 [Deltaproteobacteria bacterium]